jgi:hypothetical protein
MKALSPLSEDLCARLQHKVITDHIAGVEPALDQHAEIGEVAAEDFEDARAHLAGEVLEQLEATLVAFEPPEILLAPSKHLRCRPHRAAVGDSCVEAVVEHLPDHDEVCLDLLARVHGSTFIARNRDVETGFPVRIS